MPAMDRPTSDFYDRHALVVPREESPRSAMSAHFASAFEPGARVLDVGAGSGRDMAVLMAQGVEAWGVEPNATMRALAVSRHPVLAGRIVDGLLPSLGRPFGGGFDGVVCSAVLMHVLPADLPAALETLRGLLRPGGRLLVSLPEMSRASLHEGRDGDGRLFANHAPDTVRALLGALGLREAGRWEMVAGAAPDETRWVMQRFES